MPFAIGISPFSNTTYVANRDDNSISVIDGIANIVVAKVTFDIQPFNSGQIKCDQEIVPSGQTFYLWSGSKCTARPNPGFDFVSWQENLNGNAIKLSNVSSPSSILDPILDSLHLKPDKPESTLDITKFGSFRANFKALPPPIPPEYVATLFTVVVTALVGSWLTPTIVGWRKAKEQGSRLDHYYKEIKDLYNDGKLDKNDIEKLNKLRDNITDEYTRGRINKEQYDKLDDELAISYRGIFTRDINSLNSFYENYKVKNCLELKIIYRCHAF